MESSNVHALSLSNKRNCRMNFSTSKRGNISRFIAIWIGWKSGGQILWNAIAICEASKVSWQTGKLRMNEDLVNHSKDHLFHLVHWWNISQAPRVRQSEEIHQFGKKVLPDFFWETCFDRGANLGTRHSDW